MVARNQFGTSLPSSVVTVNVSKDAWDGQSVSGLPSSPHSMEVTETGADTLTLSWTAPTISHHQEDYKYKLVPTIIFGDYPFYPFINQIFDDKQI